MNYPPDIVQLAHRIGLSHLLSEGVVMLMEAAVREVHVDNAHKRMCEDYLRSIHTAVGTNELRIEVTGQTGSGKSAMCLLLCNELSSLGFNVHWDNLASEVNLGLTNTDVEELTRKPPKITVIETNYVPPKHPTVVDHHPV